MDSLVAKVTEAVSQSARGRCTIDELAAAFPDVARDKLQKALENASYRGEIHLLMRGELKGGKGFAPGVWGPVPDWVKKPRMIAEPIPLRRPAASVWEWGR